MSQDHSEQNEQPQVISEQMIPIPIADFVTGTTASLDVFIKLTDDKYVLIAKQDAPIPAGQIQRYKDKSVHYLYVRKQDYVKYAGTNVMIAGVAINSKELTPSRKTEFLGRATDSIFNQISIMGFSHESLEHAKSIATATNSLIELMPDYSAVMQSLSNMAEGIVAHSVAVSMISVLIAKSMGWTTRHTLEKLSLGALFHDIGLREIPVEIFERPRREWTREEIELYETHCFRGLQLLQSLPNIPEDVVSIAYEHHENALGLGYPRKLRDVRMNPLAKVVALANAFVEYTVKSPSNPHPKSPIDAIHFIEVTMGQPYNREAFAGLKKMVLNTSLVKKEEK